MCKAIEIKPAFDHAHYWLAFAFTKQDRYASAEQSYRTCIALNCSDARYYRELGMVLAKQSKYEEALRNLRAARDLNYNVPNVHELIKEVKG